VKLDAWLKREGMSREEFSSEIGRSMTSLSRYISGERMPRPAVMRRIAAVTGGSVTANDFTGEPEEENDDEAAKPASPMGRERRFGVSGIRREPVININSVGEGHFAIDVAGVVSWEDAVAISEIVQKYKR